MRTRVSIVLVALAALAFAVPVAAHPHRPWVHVGIGLGWWPWWYGPGYYEPVRFNPERQTLGVVKTDVEPEEARVYLDDRLIGTADDFDGFPDYLYLEPGHYVLEFRLAGYKSEKLEIDSKAGAFFPIDTKLQRVAGQKSGAWYDRPQDLPVGRVFGPAHPVKGTEAESHADPALRPELREKERDRDRDRGAARAESRAKGAALDLRVTPGNASVYVDGEFTGTGDELRGLERGMAIKPGKHRVEVFAPGHSARSLEIEVAEGEKQQVVIELEAGGGQTDPKDLK